MPVTGFDRVFFPAGNLLEFMTYPCAGTGGWKTQS
jgi:hypothetical protein